MEIVFHAHHAVISDDLRVRAERAVHKAAARLQRVVNATVRFEEDGPTRRVEIVLHAPKQPPVVAAGEGRLFGPALSAAAARLNAQIAKSLGPRSRSRRAAADGALVGTFDDPAVARTDDDDLDPGEEEMAGESDGDGRDPKAGGS